MYFVLLLLILWFGRLRPGKGGYPMAKTVAIVNQKGGVGKTTTCVNLAASLTALGSRVLVCDFDPQGNATSGFGVDKNCSPNIYDVLLGAAAAEKAVIHTRWADVLPSNKSLSGATVELIGVERREYRLRDSLVQLKEGYDYVFIDCPPSLELLTLDALCAADTLLVPVQCEGVLLTMYDGRTNLSMQVAEEVKRHFPGKVFASVIPRNVRLSEAPSHGKPVSEYDRLSRGAEAYEAAAKEFLTRNQTKK